jgi:hypothetical protein
LTTLASAWWALCKKIANILNFLAIFYWVSLKEGEGSKQANFLAYMDAGTTVFISYLQSCLHSME